MAKKQSFKIKEATGDRILNIIISAILIFVIFIVGYPLIYVISCSFSSTASLSSGRVVLFPVEPSLIDALHEGAERILAGRIEGEPMEFHGTKIRRCDVGVAGFLCDVK